MQKTDALSRLPWLLPCWHHASNFNTPVLYFSSQGRLRKTCRFDHANGHALCHGNADSPPVLRHERHPQNNSGTDAATTAPGGGKMMKQKGIRVGRWQINPIVLAAATNTM